MSLRLTLILLSAVAVIAVVSGTVEDTMREILAGLAHNTVEDTTREVLEGLANAPFDEWGPFFIATNDKIRGEVLRSTLFIPESPANCSYDGGEDSKKVAAYHIVPERLDFWDLLSKGTQSRLPTLLADNSILVTNNSESGFAVNGVLVTEPDIFADAYMVIHRVACPLDFTTYGRSGSDATLDSI